MATVNLASFRREVHEFIAAELPADVRREVRAGRKLTRERQTEWQRRLWRRGWIAPSWPVEHGGCAWTAAQQHVFDEECVAGDAPFVNPFGLFRAGPVLIAHGTPAQRARFLPGMLDSSTWWCQGYSEPGAGSDLAALSLRADRRDDSYVLNGTKTWTSQAHLADWMFALVRTGRAAKPREGITFLLIDMRSPGLQVRPIALMDGRDHVNEVHFHDVEVPEEHRVGGEGQGWACSQVVLGHERLQNAAVPQTLRLLARARSLAQERRDDQQRPLIADPLWSARLTELESQLMAHAAVHRRFLEQAEGRTPGPEVSMLKIRGAELRQAVGALIVELLQHDALRIDDEPGVESQSPWPLVQEFLYSRASSIYGGSNEIQRNILARQVLGL
jgi:alkylation response protein AidB-like acyl-CoA dehydrogenase